MKTYSGFTSQTPESLLLDAGAFFKNFADDDTFEKAVAAGKLIGATKDGGEFSAKPEIRQVAVDGVKGTAKGLDILDSWAVYIKANVIEITKDVIMSALCSASADTSDETYDVITASNNLELDDYIDNITWVGTLSGSNEPVIIKIFNAINTEGLTLTTKDKDQSVVAMTFNGRYSMDELDKPPFEIKYPKKAS